ncbi:pantoate--beta-alanine ligase [Sinomicrobium sp.]
MAVYHQRDVLQNLLSQQKERGRTIGLVPTMGALHEGHLSLVAQSARENDITVVSIFVNPTQFDNKDDLQKYPRSLEEDTRKLYAENPNVLIFAPEVEDVYSDTVRSDHFDFDGLEFQMEGKFRKGHFDGVGTIVKRLFEIVKPDNAYFGEKDYQQLLIVKTMVEKHHIPVQIHGCPIKREENGLAMSSRNKRLPEQLRREAGFIFEVLQQARENFKIQTPEAVKEVIVQRFEEHPEFKLEYVEIADTNTLEPALHKEKDKKYRAFIAVYADEVRLIDNIALN